MPGVIFQLGYSDQSHLLRKFRNCHGITPSEAKALALGMKAAARIT
jgi:AraC-like DNA-binding protein